MNIDEIMEILPHKYPFLLVDRVTEVEPGVSAQGYKNVSINEEFFKGHFPTYPVMPGVLILEALAQISAVAMLTLEENKGKIGLFAGADKVRWKVQVRPGDRLDLFAKIDKVRGPMCTATCYAEVDGKKACEAKMIFALMNDDADK